MEFKDRLRELRKEKGVFQQDIAALVGTSKMAVSHWEKGHSEPSIAQLIVLSDFFDVSVDFLIGKKDFD
ncbi:MAG: helix-turn-helix transcriptional regulator [Clostridia bacterium]|nr:helix-turn-helix transcriptional regulator [Clostridia bacterium]